MRIRAVQTPRRWCRRFGRGIIFPSSIIRRTQTCDNWWRDWNTTQRLHYLCTQISSSRGLFFLRVGCLPERRVYVVRVFMRANTIMKNESGDASFFWQKIWGGERSCWMDFAYAALLQNAKKSHPKKRGFWRRFGASFFRARRNASFCVVRSIFLHFFPLQLYKMKRSLRLVYIVLTQ